MSHLQRLVIANPVFHKEMRSRWRGRRLYLIPGLAVGGLMALLLVCLLPTAFEKTCFFEFYPVLAAFLGYFIATVMALLATPGLAAGFLAVERVNLTLDMLVVTRLSTWQIIVGKFVAGLLPVLLAIGPCLAIASFMDALAIMGQSDEMFAQFYLHVFLQWVTVPLLAVTGGALGTAASAFCRRLPSAMAWAYGMTLMLYFGVQHGPRILSWTNLVRYEWPRGPGALVLESVVRWCIYALAIWLALRLAHWRLYTEPSRE